jgi:hypothetical protein
VLDRYQSQTDEGTSAAVEASATGTIQYESGGYAGHTNPGHIYSRDVQGSASAQATGHPAELLRLDAHYYAPSPGTRPINFQTLPVAASASWTGDSVQLQASQGADLPPEIRLNFGLSYEAQSHIGGIRLDYNPSFTIQYNETTVTLDGTTAAAWENQPYHPMSPIALDNLTMSSSSWLVTGAFHIDLPIHTNGVSDPFSLSLSTDVGEGLTSNEFLQNSLSDLVLSLKDVTLPDGTSLTDAGYGVSFASGMEWPQPHAVPEPASVAMWAGLALAAGWWRFGKKRRLRK